MFFIWATIDAFIRYGLFTSLIMVAGAVAAFFVPFAVWIVIMGYLLFRLSAAPRAKGAGAWQKELAAMQGGRRDPSPASTPPPHEETSTLALDAREKDRHLEELLAAGELAEALRYAKEKAAQALDASDHATARVYEKYLERLRRGMR